MRRAAERKKFLEYGFCIIPNILDRQMLDGLRRETSKLLDELTDERKREQGNQGAWQPMPFVPLVFSHLVSWSPALTALADMGFASVRYTDGYIIAREPRTKSAYWHQDWPFWDEPESADYLPGRLFLMYYLIDTTPKNGCLRVIPRSHRHRLPQHDYPGHGTDTRYEDPDTSEKYADVEDQVDVAITAGDLLIGDARILHAPRANQTADQRTVLILWYVPRWDDMSGAVQAGFVQRRFEYPEGLPSNVLARLRPLFPDYTGDAQPAANKNVPSAFLRPAQAERPRRGHRSVAGNP